MRPDFTQDSSPSPTRGGFRTKAGVTAGALLLTASLIGWSASAIGAGTSPAPAPAAPVAAPSAAAARTIGASGDSYAPLIDQIAPAVVTVTSERRVRMTSSQLPDDPLLRQFFGDQFRGRQMPQIPQERRQGGLGSGVVVRADGYILTNNHVVDGADQVKVEFTDGRTFTAKVVGTDAPSDLAVLKIDGANLHTMSLADSDKVRVGDVALAVGNPLGIGQTVTMGIVSAKGRATGAGDGSYQDFIQTDAPINQGNSGGALVNTQGELIGINSQILSPSGGNIGIGFAIPANMARNVMTQLIDHGNVRRGLLGVTVQPVTADIARSLHIDNARGALVNAITPGGAADRAGVRRGDVITAINGNRVTDSNSLRNEISQMAPGTDVEVALLRDGKEQTVSVRLGELQASRAEGDDRREPGSGTGFGLSVEPLTRDTARELGVTASSGLVVTAVEPSSRAADAGLKQGDVIEEVDGAKVTTADALRSALGKSANTPALLLVHRGDRTLYLTMDRKS